jgi:DNA-binding NtrC family response regulator
MPALRERKTDIIDLADYFLRVYAQEEGKHFDGLSLEAEQKLLSYAWPGNVRQLQNILRGLVVMQTKGVITADHLPREISAGHDDKSPAPLRLYAPAPHGGHGPAQIPIRPLWQVEKETIERAIALCEGNIPKAAALLEVSPSTLYRKKMSWDKQDPIGRMAG